MGFDPSIPQPTDLLSDSQGDLLQNFLSLDTSFGRNHTKFSVATNNGKHKFVEMVNNVGIPAPVPGLSSGEGTLYTKAVTGVSQLFYTPDASTNEYQLTKTISASFATFGTNPGWTFLPGGLVMQYGSGTTSGSGSSSNGSITFPVAYAGTPYSIQISVLEPSNSRRFVKIATASNTGFTCWIQDNSGTNAGNTFYWMAIGK